jgi:hypothetical protein
MSWAQTWVHVEPLMYMLSNGNMIGKHWEQGEKYENMSLSQKKVGHIIFVHVGPSCYTMKFYISIIVHYHPYHIYVTQL